MQKKQIDKQGVEGGFDYNSAKKRSSESEGSTMETMDGSCDKIMDSDEAATT